MRTKILLLAAGTVVASASAVSATTITQTRSFGPSTTDWGTPNEIPLSFAGFNSSLGTLTGLSITGTENSSGSLTNQNNSTSSTANVTSRLINNWDAFLPSALSGSGVLTSLSTSNAATDNNLAISSSGPLHTVTGISSSTAASTGTDSLLAYQSPFTVGVDDSGSVSVHASNGNGNAAFNDSGAVSVTVTYTYTAAAPPPPPPPPVTTPEPASLALLGTGLIGMTCSLRRRRG